MVPRCKVRTAVMIPPAMRKLKKRAKNSMIRKSPATTARPTSQARLKLFLPPKNSSARPSRSTCRFNSVELVSKPPRPSGLMTSSMAPPK